MHEQKRAGDNLRCPGGPGRYSPVYVRYVVAGEAMVRNVIPPCAICDVTREEIAFLEGDWCAAIDPQAPARAHRLSQEERIMLQREGLARREVARNGGRMRVFASMGALVYFEHDLQTGGAPHRRIDDPGGWAGSPFHGGWPQRDRMAALRGKRIGASADQRRPSSGQNARHGSGRRSAEPGRPRRNPRKVALSASLWLKPSAHGTKIIAVGATSAI